MVILGEIYISGIVNQTSKCSNISLLDNPFGEGKIYKSEDIGRWTFEGKLEYLGKVKKETLHIPEDTDKKTSPKPEVSKKTKLEKSTINISKEKTKTSEIKSNNFNIKSYDYWAVNDVLARNTTENFKTILSSDPRKHFIDWWL